MPISGRTERDERFWESERREELAPFADLFVGPIGATTYRRYWLNTSPLLTRTNPSRWMMNRIVWLGFNVGHQVRIRPIAATYWLSPLIVLPLLAVSFLVV
ncbi:hypothetical protein HanXRQr2_Chr10g0425041 [Helianthus annuus]|uniref:Uncharacterized protein n=1 Tax=Helianthus annuus TaxID=4232 RepID=A0A9K3N2T5_HELAN|nr:hypothetical protein HanXRQr2_Chr10g0425041 [Helianthus annuus]